MVLEKAWETWEKQNLEVNSDGTSHYVGFTFHLMQWFTVLQRF
jgi:hypothetical protein